MKLPRLVTPRGPIPPRPPGWNTECLVSGCTNPTCSIGGIWYSLCHTHLIEKELGPYYPRILEQDYPDVAPHSEKKDLELDPNSIMSELPVEKSTNRRYSSNRAISLMLKRRGEIEDNEHTKPRAKGKRRKNVRNSPTKNYWRDTEVLQQMWRDKTRK